jgi:hypothetical protein
LSYFFLPKAACSRAAFCFSAAIAIATERLAAGRYRNFMRRFAALVCATLISDLRFVLGKPFFHKHKRFIPACKALFTKKRKKYMHL